MKTLVESLFDKDLIKRAPRCPMTDFELVKNLITKQLSNDLKCPVYKKAPSPLQIKHDLYMFEKMKWGDYELHICFKLGDNIDNWGELKIVFGLDGEEMFIRRIAVGNKYTEYTVLLAHPNPWRSKYVDVSLTKPLYTDETGEVCKSILKIVNRVKSVLKKEKNIVPLLVDVSRAYEYVRHYGGLFN